MGCRRQLSFPKILADMAPAIHYIGCFGVLRHPNTNPFLFPHAPLPKTDCNIRILSGRMEYVNIAHARSRPANGHTPLKKCPPAGGMPFYGDNCTYIVCKDSCGIVLLIFCSAIPAAFQDFPCCRQLGNLAHYATGKNVYTELYSPPDG